MSNMLQLTRAELRSLLYRWEAGELNGDEVQREAELRVEQLRPLPELDENNPDSIPLDVLNILESLYNELIIAADIPAILRFLETLPGYEVDGWTQWRSYWHSIDFDSRLKLLVESPDSIDTKL